MDSNLAEVVVHIDENLNEIVRKAMENRLHDSDNTVSVTLNRPHLLVIRYDQAKNCMNTNLPHIQEMGHCTQLTGI